MIVDDTLTVDEAWYDYCWYGKLSWLQQTIDEMDMCYLEDAFKDGWNGFNEDYYREDKRLFGHDEDAEPKSEGHIALLQAWKAGRRYRERES